MQDKQGNTPLHLGARARCPELLSVLLQGGGTAAALLKNHDGQVPLHLAAKSGNVDAVRALLQAKPSTAANRDVRGFTAQEWAAKRGHQVLSPFVQTADGAFYGWSALRIISTFEGCMSSRVSVMLTAVVCCVCAGCCCGVQQCGVQWTQGRSASDTASGP